MYKQKGAKVRIKLLLYLEYFLTCLPMARSTAKVMRFQSCEYLDIQKTITVAFFMDKINR